MDRVLLLTLILIVAGVGTSFLFFRLFTKRWIWYFPSFVGTIIIAFITLKIQSENMEGFEELGYVIMSLMIIVFIFGNLLANFFFELKTRRNNKGR